MIEQQRLKHIARGTDITARWLNETIDSVNHLQEQIRGPRQNNVRPPSPNSTPESTLRSDADEVGSVVAAAVPLALKPQETWIEIARTTSTVRITNPEDDEQYVDVQRVESLTVVLQDGRLATIVLRN